MINTLIFLSFIFDYIQQKTKIKDKNKRTKIMILLLIFNFKLFFSWTKLHENIRTKETCLTILTSNFVEYSSAKASACFVSSWFLSSKALPSSAAKTRSLSRCLSSSLGSCTTSSWSSECLLAWRSDIMSSRTYDSVWLSFFGSIANYWRSTRGTARQTSLLLRFADQTCVSRSIYHRRAREKHSDEYSGPRQTHWYVFNARR